MTERQTVGRLVFEGLRLGIERCDPNLVLGFYAEDAQLSIVNATAQRGSSFELCGKAEIAKHVRVVFSEKTSHRVEREVVGEDRVSFLETSEYPDGSRITVETTLEVRDGKIVRQVDVVARDARTGRKEEGGQKIPGRKSQPDAHTRMGASVPDRSQHHKQATEKEDLR
jgi:hypothetical protein